MSACRLLSLLALALAGCQGVATTTCPHGGVCPPGLACLEARGQETCVSPYCGDGVLDPGEVCDDGNHDDGDGCNPWCGAGCGDGYLDVAGGEVCDDGNGFGGDGCSADCRSNETCGNGVVDSSEQCDDGNLRSHDGCSSRCTTETVEWTSLSRAPIATTYGAVFDAVRGTVFVFTDAGETWEWDGARWRQRQPAVSPRGRYRPLLAFDSKRGRVVLFGGALGDNNDTWEWDGTSWIEAHPSTQPPSGYWMSLAYDEALARTIEYGGGQTWAWDGAAWTQLATAHSPSPGYYATMAYHAGRQQILFDDGGENWTFDGSDWHPAAATDGRESPGMTYDSARGVIVMTSGYFREATAEWDGSAWTFYPTTPPSAWYLAPATPDSQFITSTLEPLVATYDPKLARTVVFRPTASGLTITVLWDGQAWRTVRDYAEAQPATTANLRLVSSAHGVAAWAPDSRVWLYDGTNWEGALIVPGPTPRTNAAVVEGPFVVGGRDTSGAIIGDAWSYGYGRWTQFSGSLPTARESAGLATLGSYTVMFGGSDANGSLLSDTWILDPYAGGFTQATPATVPPARKSPVMAPDYARARVVMIGGENTSGPFVDVWLWDGTTWSSAPAPPVAPGTRRGLVWQDSHSRVLLVDQRLWQWDGVAWTDLGSSTALPPGDVVSAAYDSGHDRIVVVMSSGVIEWDGTQWLTDTAVTHLPAGRIDHVAALDRGHHVVMMSGGNDGAVLADQWQWDGWMWTPVTASPPASARTAASMVYDEARNSLIEFGGDASGAVSDPTWEWNGAGWQQLADGPNASGIASAYDAEHGQVVAFGGRDAASGMVTAEQSLWSGTWQPVSVAAPSARAWSAMAYDRTRKRAVAFGGVDDQGTDLGDVWEWDGTSWRNVTPLAGDAPSARSHHVLAWDERRGRVVLYGGSTVAGFVFDDTWEWDGASWTKLATSSPGPRYGATLANDPRGGLVLFGGADPTRGYVRETWFLRADDPNVPDEGCLPDQDGDGDGLIGCADPDCACAGFRAN